MAIYGKGCPHWVFLESGSFASESVLVFQFQSYSGPLVRFGRGVAVRGETLVPGAAGGQSFLLCTFGCMTYDFDLLSL